jgi:hypothetical protein
MGEIYEVRRLEGLRCHDIHTKFHKDWFKCSEIDRGDTQTSRMEIIRKAGYNTISSKISFEAYLKTTKHAFVSDDFQVRKVDICTVPGTSITVSEERVT